MSTSSLPRTPSRLKTTAHLPVTVAGLGCGEPELLITNQELAQRLDTSDEWILSRTGISARRVAASEPTAQLAATAATAALADAGIAHQQVDLVIVATSTPDSACPSTAARVAGMLDLHVGSFDVNGACSGFVNALHAAAALLTDPAVSTALVIGADCYTRLVDPDDRRTAILFGDGAAAVVLRAAERRPGGPGVLGADMGGDPRGVHTIEVPPGDPWLQMDGPELFRQATRGLVASGEAALQRAGAQVSDVELYVPHQANARIIHAAAQRLGMTQERVVVDIAHRANTSAASIPLALHSARQAGRLKPDTHVLVSGIGAGLSWATLLLRWGS